VSRGLLADLAAAVASGSTTSVALVTECLARIHRDNPSINAVVALRADEALAEAAAIDSRRDRGESLGPLAGIPCLVKDLEDVTGMVTTKGSVLLAADPPAHRDGLATQRLRAAGAVVVGKTNLPEFAAEGFTSNLLHGTTRNPWSTGWSPGGSSGGAGAALAAGLAPIATATDGGGSIRIPAAFCGLVGLKPTRGIVGRQPIPDWLDLTTDGPLAASVADVRLLLDVLAGPAHGDPDSFPWRPSSMPSPPTVLLCAARTSDFGPLPHDVAAEFDSAAERFAGLLGLPLLHLSPADVFPSGNIDEDWFLISSAEHVAALGRTYVLEHFEEMHPSTQDFLALGLDVGIDAYLAARRRRFEYARALDDLLGDGGLLLSPTVAVCGLPADGRLDATGLLGAWPADVYSTAAQNLTGHPAVSVPAGISPNGVPFGLQVTAPRFADSWLLDRASDWEDAYPWPLVAPGYEPFAAPADPPSPTTMGQFRS
jgi:Asp-tRNA(Asn)/Glu-tRNA(Gln) amidotransferase A subunit family amidase